jgi:hypothetical protein
MALENMVYFLFSLKIVYFYSSGLLKRDLLLSVTGCDTGTGKKI